MIFPEITLNTVQGIGDIFWIYQKFAPYFDKINLNILVIDNNCPVQKRAGDFVKLLPKIGTSSFKLVSTDFYHEVASSKIKLDTVFSEYSFGRREFDYSCNKWLEDGVRLEEIDPEFKPEFNINIKTDLCPIPYDKYITFYVSGSNKSTGGWNANQWADLLISLYKRYNLDIPIIMVGAGYDKRLLLDVSKFIKDKGIVYTIYIDSFLSNVFFIIRNSLFFIGYQSGLNIIADNFDVHQLMMYFPELRKMTDTWVKKSNITSKIFQADYFNNSVDSVLNKLSFSL